MKQKIWIFTGAGIIIMLVLIGSSIWLSYKNSSNVQKSEIGVESTNPEPQEEIEKNVVGVADETAEEKIELLENPQNTLSEDKIADPQIVQTIPSPATVEEGAKNQIVEPTPPKINLLLNTDKDKGVKPVIELKQEYAEEKKNFRSYTAVAGDTIWDIAKKMSPTKTAWNWKEILLQNKQKVDYVIFSTVTQQWKVFFEPGTVFTINQDPLPKPQNKAELSSQFTIQFGAVKKERLKSAVNVVQDLLKRGFHAYLYQTDKSIQAQNSKKKYIFYRMRVGFFNTKEEAEKVGKNILEKYSEKRQFLSTFYIVRPRLSEIEGLRNELGSQQKYPYVVQIAQHSTLSAAIKEYRQLIKNDDFHYIYISMERSKNKNIYRTRAGFFKTTSLAEEKIIQLKAEFPTAKVIKVPNLMESSLGQNLGQNASKILRTEGNS